MDDQPGLQRGADGVRRCWWCTGSPLLETYHDDEWGRPVDDEHRLFEKLCLEGFQSGLSWLTILRKRDDFRRVFRGFDPYKVARFGEKEINRMLEDASIVRHRGKIEATINNARRYSEILDEFGSLASYVWRFEPPAASRPRKLDRDLLMAMTRSAESTAMSKDLLKRGWKFVGPTTVYAFMQSMGLVNDHLTGCKFRSDVEKQRRAFTRPT